METITPEQLQLPDNYKKINIPKLIFIIVIMAMPTSVAIWVISFMFSSSIVNSFPALIMSIVVIAIFMGLLLGLFVAIGGRRLTTHKNKEFRNSIKVWAKEKYNVDLTKHQIATLSKPIDMTFRKGDTQYVSQTIEKWTTSNTGRKFLQHIILVETDDSLILFCIEDGSELESIEHKQEVEFFQNVWKEINTNEAIFALAQGTAFLGKEVNGQVAYLFWSDPLRVQLFSSENIDFEIVAIMPQTWVEEILPALTEQNALIGLNWGDEERSYPSPHIQKLIN